MRSVAVVVLVLLAGCSAVTTSPQPETVTPAPVPTDDALPPGVGPGGVTDPAVLAGAHAAVLDGASYTLIANRTVRYPNGSLRSALGVHLELSASRDYHASAAVRGPDAAVFIGEPPTRAEYWANDETYLRRQVIGNRTVYSRYATTDEYVGTWRFWLGTVALDIGPETDLRRTVESFHTGVAERPTDRDDRRTHLVGTDVRAMDFVDDQSGVRSIENATLHAFVTDSGLVDAYQVEYTATLEDGTTVRVKRTVRFRAVGNTTVERPQWYDEAMSQG
ncbi:DUF7537 family lipoprotein [Halosimplex amylolyticum]|uniref:DUF7537 family lipoprotein n=1 Tax=Halosimplex amylolyticum TaxID=3396616 RepID=UPI003F542AF1